MPLSGKSAWREMARISNPGSVKTLGVCHGGDFQLFPFLLPPLRWTGVMAGKSGQAERLLSSLQIDSAKIRRDLGWEPPYTTMQGLRAALNGIGTNYT
jgi:UDP-N-acetyl-alpha-D-quinovosamine dehydrogenase